MIAASTKTAPASLSVASIVRLVAGATALQSAKSSRFPVRETAPATAPAASIAAPGSRIDRIASQRRTSASMSPQSSMPAWAASARVRALRPASAVWISNPLRAVERDGLPMSPGLTMPMWVIFIAAPVFLCLASNRSS
jgi:hypothetical protein